MSELASASQLRAEFLRWALILVPLVLLLGFFSGVLSGSGAGNPWFIDLVKPSLYPPPATFGIVWSVLYIVMGFAAALIGAARGARGRGVALAAFAVQLVLNLAWSPLFFAGHRIFGALMLMVALDLAVVATVVLFYRVRALAAWLMVPYLGWALFATLLNWQFLEANRGADGTAGGTVTTVVIPQTGA